MSVDFQCYLKEDFSIGFRSLLVSCRTLLLISQRLILSFIFLSPPDRSALACLIEDSPVSFFFLLFVQMCEKSKTNVVSSTKIRLCTAIFPVHPTESRSEKSTSR